MAVLDIITIPDPLLKTVSAPVETVDDDVRRLVADMLETMYEAPGIGLAGVQVGVARRLLVADTVKDDDAPRAPIAMINPQILWRSDEVSSYEEGCLSIPDVYAEVERPKQVRVSFVDDQGQAQELLCDGLLATVIQHELDHLDGLLFVDHLSRLKRDRLIKKFLKNQRDGSDVVA
ncbi:MAG: peptide deformylase [Pseudomonadota bacterium]